MESASTYQAVQAVGPGRLELARKPLRDPGPGQVRIRVEACGVCHSDSGTVEGMFPIDWPRVPGHEVVGKIDMLGSNVQGWAVGQRVGVGFPRRVACSPIRLASKRCGTARPASATKPSKGQNQPTCRYSRGPSSSSWST